jgi:DnaK suppressor protein
MFATIRTPQEKLLQIGNLLTSKHQEVTSRLAEHRKDVAAEGEPDDEGVMANCSYSYEFALTTMERDRRNLAQIEQAIARLKKGEYGICSFCEKKLPGARLKAIPWATVCVPCAEGVRGPSGDAASQAPPP